MNKKIQFLYIFVIVTLMVGMVGITEAKAYRVYNVNALDDVDDGVCDGTHCSLREAIKYAPRETTILFEKNLSGQTITLTGQIDIEKNLTIDGKYLAEHIKISGGNQTRVFSIQDGKQVTIANVDIIDGLAFPGNGSAVYIYDSSVTLDHVNVKNHLSTAIYMEEANPFIPTAELYISNSLFINNNASAIYGKGIVQISKSTFENNNSGNGGALYLLDAQTTIAYSTFMGNVSNSGGGAIVQNHGNLEISNSTFYNNLTGSIGGGGIFVMSGSAISISNSTFSHNSATGVGGSLYVDSLATLAMSNTIMANSPDNWDCYLTNTPMTTDFNNLIEMNGKEQHACGTPILSEDPMLGQPALNGGDTMSMKPFPDSPVIDAGNNGVCEAYDQRGQIRPVDGDEDKNPQCDIGSVEFVPRPQL